MAEHMLRYNLQNYLRRHANNKLDNCDELIRLYVNSKKIFCEEFLKFAQLQFPDPLMCIRVALKFPHNDFPAMNGCIYFAWLHGDRGSLREFLRVHASGTRFLDFLETGAIENLDFLQRRNSQNIPDGGRVHADKLVLAMVRSEEEALELAQHESDRLLARLKSIVSELNSLHNMSEFLKTLCSNLNFSLCC